MGHRDLAMITTLTRISEFHSIGYYASDTVILTACVKRKSLPSGIGSTGSTTDTVDVIFDIWREFVVDNLKEKVKKYLFRNFKPRMQQKDIQDILLDEYKAIQKKAGQWKYVRRT